MTERLPLRIVPVGMSLAVFLVITYLVCVSYGLIFQNANMHQLLPMLLPGFIWFSWQSFFIGLLWAFAYGWYAAIVFIPIYNFFAARGRKS
ncbi:MAG: DUF5676 family membrane protein [Alphaproteobacteria bacterium]